MQINAAWVRAAAQDPQLKWMRSLDGVRAATLKLDSGCRCRAGTKQVPPLAVELATRSPQFLADLRTYQARTKVPTLTVNVGAVRLVLKSGPKPP
jgi:hypothetical protein